MTCNGMLIIIYDFLTLSITLMLDVDECQSNLDDCDVNAECSNTEGSYRCVCNLGYSGNGINCTG